MKERKVVLGFLLPPDENPPEAIHPTVGSFDDPAADLVTDPTFDRLGLGTPGWDMGCVAELLHHLLHRVTEVGFVQE